MSLTSTAQIATLAHGCTMADIDDAAWYVTRRRLSRLYSTEDAYAIAWHAIVEALYSAEEPPGRYDLFDAGERAVRQEWAAVRHHHGLGQQGYEKGLIDTTHAAFSKYWRVTRDYEGSYDFTDRIAERLSLPAVLGVLKPREYEVLAAMAAHDNDGRAAAAALDMNLDTFRGYLTRARNRAKAAWFDNETPRGSRRSTAPGRCRNGHSRAENSVVGSDGQVRCAICHKASTRRAVRRWQDRQKEEAAQAGTAGRPGASRKLIADSLEPAAPERLTFAPRAGSTEPCWCGLPFGHDWPHKSEGAPHPAAA